MGVSTILSNIGPTESGEVWQFTQLGGPGTVLLLGGWSAPFGRPRHEPIFNAGNEARYTRTDYAGVGLQPTIHTFGTKRPPVDLHGRWMDRTITATNGAQALRQQWNKFIDDQQVVRMQWGGIISYLIFATKIDLDFESPAEIAWKLKAEVLVDEQTPVNGTNIIPTTPTDAADLMAGLISQINTYVAPFGSLLGMLNGFFSGITNALFAITSAIDAPLATIVGICTACSDFSTALSTDLGALTSGLSSMQTDLLALRATSDNIVSTAVAMNQPGQLGIQNLSGGALSGADVSRLVVNKQKSDLATQNLLSLIASMQAQIANVVRGVPQKAYTAETGDTWESIGTKLMGSPDGGRAIRSMNGITYGQQPLSGRKYSIPKGF
jgi:hypothetical protein